MLICNMHEYSVSDFRLKTCVWEEGAECLYEQFGDFNFSSHRSTKTPPLYKAEIEHCIL
jgi:hypothetical protein